MKEDDIFLIKRVFGGEDGKRFEKVLKDICGANSLTTIHPDANMTYFNEGKRFVYNYLKKLSEGGINGNRRTDNRTSESK